MSNQAELELQMAGLKKQYDYTNYAHTHHINVIPEEDFKRLVSDTFDTITDVLSKTYGPYGSSVLISDQGETITTKDGYNVYQSMSFNQAYKKMVYRAINKIITRVNRNVGDGTTSCILLAEKLFNHLNEVLKTPDEKRLGMEILTDIENNLQDNSILLKDIEQGRVKKPDLSNIRPVIAVAANYDDELTDILFMAMNPLMNDDHISIRNVIPRVTVDLDNGAAVEYEAEFIPGDYRIRAMSTLDTSVKFNSPKTLKCLIYDHSFNTTDWLNLKKVWDPHEEILIIAKDFNRSFLDQDWRDFIGKIEFNKKSHNTNGLCEVNAHLFWMLGNHKQDEMKDLAAVLGTSVRNMNDKEPDLDEAPTVEVSLFKDDCMVFYDIKGKHDTSEYIKKITMDLERDETQSYVKQSELKKRIRSIRMEDDDTILNIRTGSSLEAKLIGDKVDDCIRIVESVVDGGIVPNLFRYVYDRIERIMCPEEPTTYELMYGELQDDICDGIQTAIRGLFLDIWKSKYGVDSTGGPNKNILGESAYDHMNEHYDSDKITSFDIIHAAHTDLEQFATSAQYDLEVVVASIAIVKYLLDGRAFIFDANIIPTIADDGHYA